LTRPLPLAVVRASPTSTPRDIENQCSWGFAFSAAFSFISALQPERLQRHTEARFSALKILLPHFSVNFRFQNVQFSMLKRIKKTSIVKRDAAIPIWPKIKII